MKLYTIHDKDHLLHTDLTSIQTDYKSLPKGLAAALETFCRAHRGVGVAANQLGMRENLFYVAASAKLLPSNTGNICINPTWQPRSTGLIFHKGEGCLSLPGRKFTTERFAVIDAEWTNTQGHRVKRRLRGLAAHVFQHEHDHLLGRTLLETGEEEL